ncbi:MAG: [Ni/Fe] hydrogenase small subunit, partial [Dehalococcoidia bacterium]
NVRWNDGTSWPIQAGHGCIACASHRFWENMSPFYQRLPNVPGFGADTTAEEIGLKVVAGVGAVTAAHAALKVAQAVGPKAVRAVAPRLRPRRKEEGTSEDTEGEDDA